MGSSSSSAAAAASSFQHAGRVDISEISDTLVLIGG